MQAQEFPPRPVTTGAQIGMTITICGEKQTHTVITTAPPKS